MVEYLTNNKDWLTLVVSIIVGFSTIIATFINAFLVYRQNKISLRQKSLQEKQNQPVFRISTRLEHDKSDGIYGTEYIIINNLGHATMEPCDVDVITYFKLRKHQFGQTDILLYFPIRDYFYLSNEGNTGDDEIFFSYGSGNNRKFGELYDAVLQANDSSKHSQSTCLFFLDKVILTKIKYKDIYDDEHVRYYINKMAVSDDKYNNIVSQGYTAEKDKNYDYSLYSINTISFSAMKQVIDGMSKK